jgi:hypothetical protein
MTLLEPLLETLLVGVCASALPSTTIVHANKATANDHTEDLPTMSDRSPICFLRAKSECKSNEVSRKKSYLRVTIGNSFLWKDADPDIPILKQAKAEYAKLQ